MSFESMTPYEQGWFLGQIDDVFSDDYDEEQYAALQEVFRNGEAYILYREDRTRRAVTKFVEEYIEATIKEAKRLGVEITPVSLAQVAASMCCFIGIAAGLNVVMEADEKEK